MTFTSDHIRTLASWAEGLGLGECQSSLFTLYHKMTVNKTASVEEINAIAMSAVHIIRDSEKDKAMFYSTMNSWGL